jgi:MFS family permease
MWLSIIALLNDVSSEMIYPLLPVFLLTLGGGPAMLGLIEGIAETTASFVKLATGRLSDRARRRKPLAVWGYGLTAFARPVIALAQLPWHVLVVRFTDRAGKGIRTAPRDALLTESVPPERRGVAFGLHGAADHAGAVLGPLLATLFLLGYPGQLRGLFTLAAIPALFGFALLVWKVTEVRPPAPAPGVHSPGTLGRRFYQYLGVVTLFTLGNASDAFLLLRAQQLGVAVALLPLLWAALHVSKTAWSVPGGALADRFGARVSIVAGWVLYACVYAGFAYASTAWQIWALFAVYGLFYGLTEAPEKKLISALAPAPLQGTAFGGYHFAIGIAALPASALFGLIWQTFSPEAAFLTGAAFAAVAAALLPITVSR